MTVLSVWAPGKRDVEVEIEGRRHPLAAAPDGWWRVDVPDAGPGTDYAFVLDGGPPRPDPRSAWQPQGVHGSSRLVGSDFPWTDAHWRGLPLPGAVLYEMHVGTFTPEGTFDAAVERLDGLVELGVVLDAVYNHLGPAGNYLPEFGPYLTDAHHTPWGPAVNLDMPGSDEVRRYVIDSALAWLRDYHVDGLRLDAVHAFVDARATHLLEELAVAVQALGAQLRKPLWLVAESDLNDPRLVTSREAGGYGLDGQWADDVHHSVHALLTGERAGYYGDFGSLATLAQALTGVFVHDGTWSSFRGRRHGRPVPPTLPGHRFVVYLQDHDQVGNRAVGDRIAATLSDGLLQIGAALVLTSPYTPMLWMGEEWGARTPWQFFSDHEAELGEAVSRGRRAEFARHGWATEEVPDPQAESTYRDSQLDWTEREGEREQALLAWTRELLALRRARPELSDGRRDRVLVTYDEDDRWVVVQRGRVAVACNLAPDRRRVPLLGTPQGVLLASRTGFVFADGQVETDGESVVVLELVDAAQS